ncbi:MAG TPA: cytochrome c1 [Woeseiaceae bacterium]|nr:cytochrome c1 [Woeseiaceae bacterium]
MVDPRKASLAPAAILLGLITAGFAGVAGAAEEIELEPAENQLGNVASLQRGARNFMNFCSGCHSARYVRYNTIAKDLMLNEDQVIEYLMFNAEKTFETVQATMPAESAAKWFGRSPPDLSLMARARGTDYIYNYLKGFYLDPDSPTGVDNILLGGTSMPHVLWRLQGYQEAVFDEVQAPNGGGTEKVFSHFENVTEGILSPEDYDDFVRDTVNFLEYISEPVRGTRRVLGVWVLIGLGVFLIIANMLKNQIWKDVS